MSKKAGIARKIDRVPWYVKARGFVDIILGFLGLLLSIFWIINMHSAPYVVEGDPEVLALQIPYIYFMILSITLMAVGVHCLKWLESLTRINALLGYLLLLEGLLMLPVTFITRIVGPYIPSGGDYIARDMCLFLFGRCPFIIIGFSTLRFTTPARRWNKRLGKRTQPVLNGLDAQAVIKNREDQGGIGDASNKVR